MTLQRLRMCLSMSREQGVEKLESEEVRARGGRSRTTKGHGCCLQKSGVCLRGSGETLKMSELCLGQI